MNKISLLALLGLGFFGFSVLLAAPAVGCIDGLPCEPPPEEPPVIPPLPPVEEGDRNNNDNRNDVNNNANNNVNNRVNSRSDSNSNSRSNSNSSGVGIGGDSNATGGNANSNSQGGNAVTGDSNSNSQGGNATGGNANGGDSRSSSSNNITVKGDDVDSRSFSRNQSIVLPSGSGNNKYFIQLDSSACGGRNVVATNEISSVATGLNVGIDAGFFGGINIAKTNLSPVGSKENVVLHDQGVQATAILAQTIALSVQAAASGNRAPLDNILTCVPKEIIVTPPAEPTAVPPTQVPTPVPVIPPAPVDVPRVPRG